MTRYMLANFSQGITDSAIRVEGMMVFSRIPFLKGRKTLRHGGKKTDNDLYRCTFHLITEIVDQSPFLNEVSVVLT